MLLMSLQPILPVSKTYEPFSKEPEYIEANQAFVNEQDFSTIGRFLDLACGTGLVSGMLLAAQPNAHLHGTDYDPVQIDLAEAHLSSLGHPVRRGFDLSEDRIDGKPVTTLGVASADDLPFPDHSFDCVTICNAIHMLPDKAKLLREVSRVLRPGGRFGFNTSFYAGTYAPGTEDHLMYWVAEADKYIKRLNEEREAQGQERIKRLRGQSHAAFQNKWHSEGEWVDLLREAGLECASRHTRVVMLNERCFAAIAAYAGLAEVLLSGYPVEISSEALQATTERSLELCGAKALPRNYLEVWAVRR
jgi:ubiquinone/menaquinone biosynthesis C-methylase UbiE